MTTLHTNSRSDGQTAKRERRSQIRTARVRLLPLNTDGYQRPHYSESPISLKYSKLGKSKSTEQQKHSPFFFGWTLLPMRLFLGVTFAYAGIQKLADPQFFDPAAPGYIGSQIRGFAQGSPLHDLLIQVAVPHAVFFGYAIAFGEIAIGLGTLFGLLFRPAAFFGLILSLAFFLSASWLVSPYFYGADLVFAFCWLIMLLHGPVATGYPTLDTWLMTTLFPQKTSGLRAFVRILLIGSPNKLQTVPLLGESSNTTDVRTSSLQGDLYQNMRAIAQRKREARRNFLLGAITGVSGAVGLGIIGFVINARFSNGESTASSTIIAQASAIAKNKSMKFTIPSTSHQGILIHLPDDQFVAYNAACTHAGCLVNYDPADQHLVCPCHGATYDPAQQAVVLSGPTKIPLTAVPIGVDKTTGTIIVRS